MPISAIATLFFIGIIFSTAMDYQYSVETFSLITLAWAILVFLGLWISLLRKYERAQLNFHPEGIIMSTTSGYIPLKYEHIKTLSTSNITFRNKKSQFYVIAKDNRKFEIQTTRDVYESLVEYFPEV